MISTGNFGNDFNAFFEKRKGVSCIAGAMHINTCTKILCEIGYQKIEVEPIHYYTKEVLEPMAGDKTGITDSEWKLIDKAFAGSHIKATVPVTYIGSGW
jgi:hypothetical protein